MSLKLRLLISDLRKAGMIEVVDVVRYHRNDANNKYSRVFILINPESLTDGKGGGLN